MRGEFTQPWVRQLSVAQPQHAFLGQLGGSAGLVCRPRRLFRLGGGGGKPLAGALQVLLGGFEPAPKLSRFVLQPGHMAAGLFLLLLEFTRPAGGLRPESS